MLSLHRVYIRAPSPLSARELTPKWRWRLWLSGSRVAETGSDEPWREVYLPRMSQSLTDALASEAVRRRCSLPEGKNDRAVMETSARLLADSFLATRFLFHVSLTRLVCGSIVAHLKRVLLTVALAGAGVSRAACASLIEMQVLA